METVSQQTKAKAVGLAATGSRGGRLRHIVSKSSGCLAKIKLQLAKESSM